MEFLSVEGIVNVDVAGFAEVVMAGKLASEKFGNTTLTVMGNMKDEQQALHALIANGKIKTVIFSTDELKHLVPPSDTTMFAHLMDKAGIDQVRLNRYDASLIDGGVMFYMDDATQEYVIRRTRG